MAQHKPGHGRENRGDVSLPSSASAGPLSSRLRTSAFRSARGVLEGAAPNTRRAAAGQTPRRMPSGRKATSLPDSYASDGMNRHRRMFIGGRLGWVRDPVALGLALLVIIALGGTGWTLASRQANQGQVDTSTVTATVPNPMIPPVAEDPFGVDGENNAQVDAGAGDSAEDTQETTQPDQLSDDQPAQRDPQPDSSSATPDTSVNPSTPASPSTSPDSGSPAPSKPSASASATPSADASPAVAPAAKKVTWRSGVFTDAQSTSSVQQWQTWRAAPAGVVMGYSARSTWQEIVHPGWLYEDLGSFSGLKAYGVAMIPQRGASISACASGDYAHHWRAFARNLNDYDQGAAVLRLGWNFSDSTSTWAASNPSTWKRCWRSIVETVRSVAPQVQWEWSTKRGVATAGDPFDAYPGDDVVDIIGVDNFDQSPAATTAQGWQQQLSNPSGTGLNDYLGFAGARGKKLSISAWGVSHHGGGGQPQFYYLYDRFFP